jgi:hypothetical protein
MSSQAFLGTLLNNVPLNVPMNAPRMFPESSPNVYMFDYYSVVSVCTDTAAETVDQHPPLQEYRKTGPKAPLATG